MDRSSLTLAAWSILSAGIPTLGSRATKGDRLSADSGGGSRLPGRSRIPTLSSNKTRELKERDLKGASQ
jgi:hypothetical protein